MTRLLVVDDHEIVRAGVKRLLAEISEFTVAGEAVSGADAVSMVREADWDVVLLDISMPDINGIDALQQIKQSKPELPVLILSSHPEEIYAINLLRAGAGGYLNKVCATAELVGAIRTVASGGKYVSSSLRRRLDSESRSDGHKIPHNSLSQREFQVFCKLAEGQELSKIAQDLMLSVKTVASYRARLLEKMGMRTVADITYYAMKHGLIQ